MSAEWEPDVVAMSDLAVPWCLRTVVSLGVAERIVAGTTDVAALAAEAGVDADALHAVLTYLSDRGVFERRGLGRFGLNAAARRLLDPGVRLGLSLEGIGGRMAAVWSTLPQYVRTGRSAYAELYGRSFWQDLEHDPALGQSFDALMGPLGHGVPDVGFPLVGGWRAVRSVVDVGGGSGTALAEILRRRPWLRGALVDLPRVVAQASAVFRAAGVEARADTVGQSFFDPLPSGADLYLLRKVLNDWPDLEAGCILRRCAEAAGDAGRVVVIGGVDPDGVPPRIAPDMLLAGGRTRPLGAFAALAASAGLRVRRARRHRNAYVVECAALDR